MQNIYTTSDKTLENVINLPINSFEYIDSKIEISLYDGLIFTSKHAIYALDKFCSTWKNIPCYAIGKGTSKILQNMGIKSYFTSETNYGNEFAHELKEIAHNKKFLYLRGEKVASNLSEILECDETIVYKNSCNEVEKRKTLPQNSFIIFTSPLLVECYLKHYIWDETHKAIAIGKTTANSFPGNITPIIADTPSLESCIEKIKTLSSNYCHSS